MNEVVSKGTGTGASNSAVDGSQFWWQSFFSPLYARIYRGPLAHPEATADEVALLAEVFDGVQGPVLDLGCGFGRHAVPLGKKGVRVVGLDVMDHLLREIPARGRRVVQADMRALPLRDGSMAGAYCLFNTFGYFTPDDNKRVLVELGRVMAPGAALVMQCPNRTGMAKLARNFPPRQMLTSDAMLSESYGYDAATKSLVGTGQWIIGDKEQHWNFSLRLYTGAELAKLLKGAGFVVERHLGEPSGEEFDARHSTEQVVVARRAC